MDWLSAYHYGLMVQQERLRHAREGGTTLNMQRVREWLSALRATLGRHRRTQEEAGQVMEKRTTFRGAALS